jgi:hypothetical protein
MGKRMINPLNSGSTLQGTGAGTAGNDWEMDVF